MGIIWPVKNILKLIEQGAITSSIHERLLELENAMDNLSGRIAAEFLIKDVFGKANYEILILTSETEMKFI